MSYEVIRTKFQVWDQVLDAPVVGEVSVVPNVRPIKDTSGSGRLLTEYHTLRLDDNGWFEADLAASDDPNLTPTGFSYVFTIKTKNTKHEFETQVRLADATLVTEADDQGVEYTHYELDLTTFTPVAPEVPVSEAAALRDEMLSLASSADADAAAAAASSTTAEAAAVDAQMARDDAQAAVAEASAGTAEQMALVANDDTSDFRGVMDQTFAGTAEVHVPARKNGVRIDGTDDALDPNADHLNAVLTSAETLTKRPVLIEGTVSISTNFVSSNSVRLKGAPGATLLLSNTSLGWEIAPAPEAITPTCAAAAAGSLTVQFPGAAWTADEHKGKWVCITDDTQNPISLNGTEHNRRVLSNTADTLTLDEPIGYALVAGKPGAFYTPLDIVDLQDFAIDRVLNSSPGASLTIRYAKDVRIERVRTLNSGKYANVAGNAVQVYHCDKVRGLDNEVTHAGNFGVFLYHSKDIQLYGTKVNGFAGQFGIQAKDCSNVLIKGARVYGDGVKGDTGINIKCSGLNRARKITVEDCYVEKSRKNDYEVSSIINEGDQFSAEDLVFRNCTSVEAVNSGFASIPDALTRTTGIVWESCTAIKSGTKGFAAGFKGMKVLNPTATNCAQEGVAVTADDVTVQGGTLQDNCTSWTSGLSFSSEILVQAVSRTKINMVKFKHTGTPGKALRAVRETGTCVGTVVSFCGITEGVARYAQDYLLTGTNSVAFGHPGEDSFTGRPTIIKVVIGRTTVLDVRNFGAVGDGVTNDYAALAAALSEAVTRGGIVDLGGLTYKFNSRLIVPAGVTIRNGGLTTTLLTSGEQGAIDVNAGDIHFENVDFSFGGSAKFGVFADQVGAANITIKGGTATGASSHAFAFNDKVTDSEISGVTFTSVVSGVRVRGACERIKVNYNTITDWLTYGIEVRGVSGVGAPAVVETIGNTGSNPTGGDPTTVTGRAGQLIRYLGAPDAVTTDATNDRNVCVGPSLAFNPGTNNNATGDMIGMQWVDRFTCNDNRMQEGGENGISITDGCTNGEAARNITSGNDGHGLQVSRASATSTNVRVHDNISFNNNQNRAGNNGGLCAGIFAQNSTSCHVYNNRCYDDQGTKTQNHGILVSVATDLSLYGNDLDGNLTGRLSETGTCTYLRKEDDGAWTIPSLTVTGALDAGSLALTGLPFGFTEKGGSDQSWTSDGTLATITGLSIAVPANSYHEVTFNIEYTASTAGDIAFCPQFSSSGHTFSWRVLGPSIGVAANNGAGTGVWLTGDNSTASIPAGGSGTTAKLTAQVLVRVKTGANAGSVTLQAAQNASDTTATTVLSTSTVEAVRKS